MPGFADRLARAEAWADHALDLDLAGARVIGGGAGTTEEHLHALASALGSLHPSITARRSDTEIDPKPAVLGSSNSHMATQHTTEDDARPIRDLDELVRVFQQRRKAPGALSHRRRGREVRRPRADRHARSRTTANAASCASSTRSSATAGCPSAKAESGPVIALRRDGALDHARARRAARAQRRRAERSARRARRVRRAPRRAPADLRRARARLARRRLPPDRAPGRSPLGAEAALRGDEGVPADARLRRARHDAPHRHGAGELRLLERGGRAAQARRFAASSRRSFTR